MDEYTVIIGTSDTATAEEARANKTVLISATPTDNNASVLIEYNGAVVENNTELYCGNGGELAITVTNVDTVKTYTVTIHCVYTHSVDPTY